MKYILSLLALVLSFCAIAQPAPQCGDRPIVLYHDPITCESSCTNLHAIVNGENPINTGITGDDVYSAVLPIGFTFNYYGGNFTQCVIGSNGMINFDLTLAGTYDPWPITALLAGNASAYGSICGPWCDIYQPAGGTITYATSGVAPYRRFTATWCHTAMYNTGTCPNEWTTTQIILYESCNLIDVHVGHKTSCAAWNGGYAIIGVQNAAGTSSTAAPGRDWPIAYTCTNEAWRFTPAGASYNVAAIPYAPVPNAGSIIKWFNAGGAQIGTGTTLPCQQLGTSYSVQVAGCDFVTTAVINVPPASTIEYDTMTLCLNTTLPLPVLPAGGTWGGGPASVATIVTMPLPGSITGVGIGTATYTYNYATGGCRYQLTVHVVQCHCDTCDCDDHCYWRLTGNNIHGTRNIFGTLSNNDIRIVSNNTQRAVIQAGGNMGIRQLSPSTTLDVDCVPTAAPSGLQFENLPIGMGNALVVDAAGYVYRTNSMYARPAPGGDNTELQNQINLLKQQLEEMSAKLNSLTSVPGDNSGGNSLSVTPNPTDGQFNVSYTIAGAYNNAVIKVTDVQGRLIVSRPVTNNTGSANITLPGSVAPGNLIITLVVDGKAVGQQKEVLVK
jgi:hypothetical protein